MKIIKSFSNSILIKRERNFKMNKRFIVALVLLGMVTSLLPKIIQLGLFFSLFVYLYISWDEYMYQQAMTKKRRKKQNV